MSGETAHPCKLQTSLQNKTQMVHKSVMGGLTDPNGKGPAETGHQYYGPIWGIVPDEVWLKQN